MERREFMALLGGAAAVMPSMGAVEAHDAQASGDRLAGTWSYVSSVNTRRDGSVIDRWGDNARGMLMFDGIGHFSQIIIGSESRMFGSKTFCAFGGYSIDEAKKLLVTHIAASSSAKLIGTSQYRDIVELTPAEFKYTNPLTSHGAVAEVLWKRIA